ncbi:YifB family Mg chelatase-like AAA ATPase [Nakamurella sp. A5-74]|uniref:YifB family Mg chelatase-like AAA ATPase n=1 Tax=Nakamurella sp. A5-74 TaxID=3158264 RepID=A0AAU8DK12_9ACTN
MSLARTWSVAPEGVFGHLIEVEADLAAGLPGTTVIGLGDAAVQQAKDRVRAALANSGLKWPDRKVTIALSPAALPKKGAGFDLAVAIAVLAADDRVPLRGVVETALIGELGLDGGLRPVRGVLPLLLAARRGGLRAALVPVGNLREALHAGIPVRGVPRLADLVAHLRGESDELVDRVVEEDLPPDEPPDMLDVLGQPVARQALEIAAAGGHHVAMIGPPGAGKTMLAMRLPSLLPPLDEDDSLEVTAVHSVAGTLAERSPLITRPPFVDPHHSASLSAVIGGGSGTIRPGSVSLAHRGILFLDESPEFKPTVLDALRQPLESGHVLVSRASGTVRFPARFQLVLAANPCPCAAARDTDCCCASGVRRRYLGRLSGPLLDRVDIRVDLPPVDPSSFGAGGEVVEGSAAIGARVQKARLRSEQRWRSTHWRTNAEVPGPTVRRWFRAHACDTEIAERAVRVGRLTGRGFDRVLRLALTAADLAERDRPIRADLALALALRCGEEL